MFTNFVKSKLLKRTNNFKNIHNFREIHRQKQIPHPLIVPNTAVSLYAAFAAPSTTAGIWSLSIIV